MALKAKRIQDEGIRCTNWIAGFHAWQNSRAFAYQSNAELKPYGEKRNKGRGGKLLKPELIKSITWLMWKRVRESWKKEGAVVHSAQKRLLIKHFFVTF